MGLVRPRIFFTNVITSQVLWENNKLTAITGEKRDGISKCRVGCLWRCLGSAFSQGIAAKAAMEGMARQPSASGDIRLPVLAMAFMETTLFSFVAAILLWTKI